MKAAKVWGNLWMKTNLMNKYDVGTFCLDANKWAYGKYWSKRYLWVVVYTIAESNIRNIVIFHDILLCNSALVASSICQRTQSKKWGNILNRTQLSNLGNIFFFFFSSFPHHLYCNRDTIHWPDFIGWTTHQHCSITFQRWQYSIYKLLFLNCTIEDWR